MHDISRIIGNHHRTMPLPSPFDSTKAKLITHVRTFWREGKKWCLKIRRHKLWWKMLWNLKNLLFLFRADDFSFYKNRCRQKMGMMFWSWDCFGGLGGFDRSNVPNDWNLIEPIVLGWGVGGCQGQVEETKRTSGENYIWWKTFCQCKGKSAKIQATRFLIFNKN